jgi:hypothetical protein
MSIKHIKTVSYRSTDRSGNPVPFIQIQGKFLKKLNFPVGSKIRVNYHKDFVHISKILEDRFGEACLTSAVARK